MSILQKQKELLISLKNEVSRIEDLKKNELSESIKFYISLGLKESDLVRYQFETLSVYRDRPDQNTKDEILSVNFKGSREGNWKVMNEVYMNFYTTSEASDYQLNRLITLGKVAALVLENKKSMIDDFNRITSKYEKMLKDPEDAYYAQSKIVDNLKEEEKLARQGQLILKAETEGFKVAQENRVNLSIGRRKHISSIISAKVLTKTKSGKTFGVELTTQRFADEDPSTILENLKRVDLLVLLQKLESVKK